MSVSNAPGLPLFAQFIAGLKRYFVKPISQAEGRNNQSGLSSLIYVLTLLVVFLAPSISQAASGYCVQCNCYPRNLACSNNYDSAAEKHFNIGVAGLPEYEYVGLGVETPGAHTKLYYTQHGNFLSYHVNLLPIEEDPEYYFLTINTPPLPQKQCERELNPCSPITGDKFQTEVDYVSAGSTDFVLSRSYSSLGSGRWQHNFVRALDNTQNETLSTHVGPAAGQSALYATPDAACTQGWNNVKASAWNGSLATATVVYEGGDLCAVSDNGQLVTRFKIQSTTGAAVGTPPQNLHTLTRANGSRYVFQQSGSDWIDPFNPEVKLVASGTDWIFTDSNQTKETYNANGQLITITPASGRSRSLSYDLASGAGGDDNPDTLDQITDASGRSLNFSYSPDGNGQPRLSTLTTPDGDLVYGYDAEGNMSTVSYPDATSKTYHYEDTNFPHHLTGITDENSIRFATWAYDANGKAISSEHAGGVERGTFTYNADGTTTVTGALGDTRVYHFEVQNGARVVSQITGDQCTTCGNGHMQSRTYDANGFLSGYSDWNGYQTALVNNARGLVESRTKAVGTPEERMTTTVWHTDFNQPTQINEPGRTTALSYNSSGQLISRTVTDTATAETHTTTYSYHPTGTNGAGLIASVDGPRTDVNDNTTYGYDASDNLISITNALGHVTQITSHDASGRPTTLIDPNGVQTDLLYDPRGRLLSITHAVGSADAATTTLSYDAVGQITRITLGDGSFLDYAYDNAHRLTTMTDSLGNTITYTLDDMGNRTKVENKDPTDTLTQTQSQVFDQLSRLTDIIGAQNQTTLLAYDDNHNPIGQTDALTRQSSSTFDALDQLIQSTDPDQQQTGFTYDARGNLSSVTDAKGLITTYSYNGFDEVISQLSPDTGTTTFTYDKAGNPTSQTDARGVTVNYSYDALNRLTQISYPDSSLDVTYTYDENNPGQNGIGRLTTVVDASGTSTYTYDTRGNLTQRNWQQANHSTFIDYAYDAADRISQITYPSGRTVDMTRNTAGQIIAVTTTFNGTTQTLANNIGYLPFGPANAMTYGNGLAYSTTYDLDYQLDNQTTAGVQQRDYTQDDVGNISSISDLIDNSHNQGFGYDNLDRLNSAQGNYGTLGYGYDPIGNRLNKTTDGNIANYSYANQSHQLQSISGSVNQSYQYDANGNTTDNGVYQFTYGDDNRLHSVSQNGTAIATYTYNAQGQRSSKTVAGVTTDFHYNQSGNLIAETDAAGNTQQAYIWLNGQPLALVQTSSEPSGGGSGPVALLNETNLSGIQGQALHYSFEVPANASSLNVLMQTTSGDPDLYVRYGSAPTEGEYDCRPYVDEPQESCDFTNPQAGTWHVMILGYSDFAQTQLTAQLSLAADPGETTAILNETSLTGLQGQSLHYSFEIAADATQLNILMQTSSGDPDLYVRYGSAPTEAGYDCRPYVDEPEETCDFTNPQAGTWHVMLLGYSDFSDTSLTASVTTPTENTGSTTTTGIYYYHNDHLGTPQSLTDESQGVVWEADYTPFGEAVIVTETVSSNLRLPGQYFDGESGLHYNYFRYYDPTTGRYMTSDPIGLAGGINTYLYANANPVVWVDPYGLRPVPCPPGTPAGATCDDGKNNAGVNHGCRTAFCGASIKPVDACSNCRAGCIMDFANPIPGISFSEGAGAIGGKVYSDVGHDLAKDITGKGFKIYGAYNLGSCLEGCKSVCPKNRCE